MMKKYLILCFALVLASACSMQEDPGYFVNRDAYFKNAQQCQSAVNSIYVGLKNVYTFKMFTLTEAHSDIIYEPAPTVTEARMELSPAQPGFGEDIWKYAYQMIMYANYAIAGTENCTTISEEAKAKLLSEAVTMRAFWYYILTSFFGDVPYYTYDVTDAELMEQAAHLPRMSAVETRRHLVAELERYFGYDNAGHYLGSLPQLRTYDTGDNRAGWAVAMMLIAKMSMWNAAKEPAQAEFWYDTAIAALERLENVYGALDQYPLEEVMFRYKNTPESIMEVQHEYSSGGLAYYSNLACVCMPVKAQTREIDPNTGEEIVITTWDGIQVDELGDLATYWTAARPNLYFSAGLQTNGSDDLRAPINMAWDYNGVSFQSVSTRPWMGRKFWCPGMYSTYDSNNYKIFRYADALLMLAECWCAKQDQDKTLRYLNMVKSRAGLPDYVFKSWKKTFTEIQDERARELFGEFQRRFDLVRWGEWYERMKNFNDYEELQYNIRECHEYLPIPDKQVKYSGYALDNKEYNKYGM